MARMYSRAKGRSGSSKPIEMKQLSWQRYKEKEVELLVTKLAKEGLKPSQIGLHLRDSYGIPDVKFATNKKITQILAEKKLAPTLPEDMMALLRKRLAVAKHLSANKKDMSAVRGVEITDSKIRKLAAYCKKAKKLPSDWAYNPDEIKLYIE